MYHYNGSQWVQIGQDIYGEDANDRNGFSVSLNSNGTILAIGTPYDGGNGTYRGQVRVYHYNGSQWVKIGQDIYDDVNYLESGFSVSLNSDGTILAVGTPYNEGNSYDIGHLRVYQLTH